MNHPEYKEGTVRDKIWEEISTKMSLPVDACKHRWRNIRDCYKRSIRGARDSQVSQVRTRPKKQYTLAEYLTFLEKIEDEDIRSNPQHQEDFIDADSNQIFPSFEVILEAANGENGLCLGVKQERDDYEEYAESGSCKDEQNEENENFETEQITEHSSNLYTAVAFNSLNVGSTSNLDNAESSKSSRHYKMTNTMRKLRNKQKRKSYGRGKLLKRALTTGTEPSFQFKPTRRTKQQQEDFSHFMVQERIPQVEASQSSYDETDLFFQSMAQTAKPLHPVLLAEMKKKVCAIVMDSVIENEKFISKLQPQVYYSSKTSPSDSEINRQQEQ